MCLHPSSAYHLQLHVEMRDSSSADFLSHTVKQCLVDSTLYAVTPTPIEISMNPDFLPRTAGFRGGQHRPIEAKSPF